jgi:molybdopterin/thiamine biosynthesis adenylyltransferase
VHQLGLNKAVITARALLEIDPYLDIAVEPAGVTAGRVDAFLVEGGPADLLVEECDSLDIKLLLRERARAHKIPVVMETSDRGMLDVERYDLEPDRPILHGLAGSLSAADLGGLSRRDKVQHVLRILEPTQISDRFAATLPEIDRTVHTWPPA